MTWTIFRAIIQPIKGSINIYDFSACLEGPLAKLEWATGLQTDEKEKNGWLWPQWERVFYIDMFILEARVASKTSWVQDFCLTSQGPWACLNRLFDTSVRLSILAAKGSQALHACLLREDWRAPKSFHQVEVSPWCHTTTVTQRQMGEPYDKQLVLVDSTDTSYCLVLQNKEPITWKFTVQEDFSAVSTQTSRQFSQTHLNVPSEKSRVIGRERSAEHCGWGAMCTWMRMWCVYGECVYICQSTCGWARV